MSYLADNWYWMVAAAASGSTLLWLQLKEGAGAGIRRLGWRARSIRFNGWIR